MHVIHVTKIESDSDGYYLLSYGFRAFKACSIA